MARKRKITNPISVLEQAIQEGDEDKAVEYTNSRMPESFFVADVGGMEDWLPFIESQLEDKNFSKSEPQNEEKLVLEYGSRKISIDYEPLDTLYERTVIELAEVLFPDYETRAYSSSKGSTDACLIIREKTWWEEMDQLNPEFMKKLFIPVRELFPHLN